MNRKHIAMMGCVEEKIKASGLVRGSAQNTLLEEMRIFKEMQDQSGTRKALNTELWHACAGPLVSLPPAGSLVVYFPQGHSEQVAASTNRALGAQIPNYPNVPSQLICQVRSVSLHADKETDEIYAQMSLQPVHSESDIFPVPDSRYSLSKHPNEFFCKTLTASDTSTHGGFSVPRRAAEKLFPPLDYSAQPPNQELVVRDLHDSAWTFRHIYRGQPKRHLLTTGWSLFVGSKRLKAGDSVLFIRDEKSQLLVGVRRANRGQSSLPSCVLSADSMHIGVIAAAAHAAANRTQFTIFYNPRASSSEFVVPLARYQKSASGAQLSVGMRFGMMFETEDSGKRRYMGTIVGISDIDPVRWPGSRWRNLQVEWDEPGCTDKPTRVSAWEIETPETFFLFPSMASGLKRPFHPGLLENGWESLIKRPFTGVSGLGNGLLPLLGSTLCPEELMKTMLKPQVINTCGISRPAMQPNLIGAGVSSEEAKVTMVVNNLKPQVMNQEVRITREQCFSEFGSSTTNSPKVVVGQQILEQSDSHRPARVSSEQVISEHEPASGQNSQEKFGAPEARQDQSGISMQGQNNHNSMKRKSETSQEISLPVLDCVTTIGPVSFQETNGLPSCPPCRQPITEMHRSQGLPLMFGNQDSSAVLSETNDSSFCNEMWNQFNSYLPEGDTLDNICAADFRKLPPDEGLIPTGGYFCDAVSNVLDSSISNSVFDDLSAFKDVELKNPTDCLLGNLSSSQDVQSHLTSTSFPDSQTLSRQDLADNSGCGMSSSHVDFSESSLLQSSSRKQVAPARVRTYTKVQKAGSVGRSIDVTSFRNYGELISAIECMFGLEGLLSDPKGSGWKLVYVDYENDVLLVGDDPWKEFVGCVRCIRILSPSEVEQMSQEGMALLNSAAFMHGGKGAVSG